MKAVTFTIILLSAFIFRLEAQEYKNAIGARLGLSSGFSYQHNIDDFRGYKGLMSFREGGIQITGLIESYRPLYLNFTDKIFYYAGMGAHIGFTRWPAQRGIITNPFRYYSGDGNFAPVIGMDAIIGIEYRLYTVPLTFSLDAKPFFELFGQNFFRLSLFDIGFTIKFTFN